MRRSFPRGYRMLDSSATWPLNGTAQKAAIAAKVAAPVQVNAHICSNWQGGSMLLQLFTTVYCDLLCCTIGLLRFTTGFAKVY